MFPEREAYATSQQERRHSIGLRRPARGSRKPSGRSVAVSRDYLRAMLNGFGADAADIDDVTQHVLLQNWRRADHAPRATIEVLLGAARVAPECPHGGPAREVVP